MVFSYLSFHSNFCKYYFTAKNQIISGGLNSIINFRFCSVYFMA
jgi:hypothetical protein